MNIKYIIIVMYIHVYIILVNKLHILANVNVFTTFLLTIRYYFVT